MADTDQADVLEDQEQEADSQTVETDDQSDDELESLLADFRKQDKSSDKPEKKKDVSLEDRLRQIEERETHRAQEDYQRQLNERLEQTVDEIIKASPELKKITRAGVRGTLIGDLYRDSDLVVAFSDRSNPAGYKKLVNSLAKRYAKELPEDTEERDDTRAVLSEVRGVSTRAPKKPDESEFARTASRDDFLNKYGSMMPSFIR